MRKSMKQRMGFMKKINKINKLLSRLTKEKIEDTNHQYQDYQR